MEFSFSKCFETKEHNRELCDVSKMNQALEISENIN